MYNRRRNQSVSNDVLKVSTVGKDFRARKIVQVTSSCTDSVQSIAADLSDTINDLVRRPICERTISSAARSTSSRLIAVESRITASSAGRSGDPPGCDPGDRAPASLRASPVPGCSSVHAGVCRRRRMRFLPETPISPHLGRRIQKYLHLRVRETHVPISRPSITTPPASPRARCCSTIQARSCGCTETLEAAEVTSVSRTRRDTSMPSSSTRLPSICGCS